MSLIQKVTFKQLTSTQNGIEATLNIEISSNHVLGVVGIVASVEWLRTTALNLPAIYLKRTINSSFTLSNVDR